MLPILLVQLLLVTGFGQAEKPIALQRMEESRQAILVARIEWAQFDQKKTPGGNAREWYRTTRISGLDQLEVDHGNRDGVIVPDQLGEEYSCSERRLLRKNGEQWFYIGGSISTSVEATPTHFHPMLDLRTLGMAPDIGSHWTPIEYLPDMPQSYRETVNGTIHRVSAIFDNGIAFSWDIDASKNYSPIKCEITQNGKALAETNCEYDRFDGVWFPVRTTFSTNGRETRQIVVLNASFGDTEEAAGLSERDLGMIPGTTVAREIGSPPLMWDGEKQVSIEDYFDGVKAGTIDNTQYEDFIRRAQTEGHGRRPQKHYTDSFGLGNVEREPGLWEEYVRRFIRKHALDIEKTRKAWRIHKPCQAQALKYLKAHRDEMATLDRELVKARSGGTEKQGEIDAIESRMEKKLEPVRRIFENKLKPGLSELIPKMPTSAPGL